MSKFARPGRAILCFAQNRCFSIFFCKTYVLQKDARPGEKNEFSNRQFFFEKCHRLTFVFFALSYKITVFLESSREEIRQSVFYYNHFYLFVANSFFILQMKGYYAKIIIWNTIQILRKTDP